MNKRLGLVVLPHVNPSPAEVERARSQLSRQSCPRRYCWYWHTLSFDWHLKPEEGCEVGSRHIHRLVLEGKQGQAVPEWQQCCRATGNPQHADYYEPREPVLREDGWPEDYFHVIGKNGRRRRFERRQRDRRRQHKDEE
jgi:hypothetical protein